MYNVYLYLPDALADWEIGHLTAELHSKRFFRTGAPRVEVRTIALTAEPVRTMGGLSILPDGTMNELTLDSRTVLLLPGAGNKASCGAATEAAARLLDCGGTVCAICSATVALANAGLLDRRPHTSNGVGFLEAFCPAYKGQSLYVDAPSVSDGGLITAGAAGALLWTKQILERLDVFRPDTLSAWYDYFATGVARHFFALMQSLPSARKKQTVVCNV